MNKREIEVISYYNTKNEEFKIIWDIETKEIDMDCFYVYKHMETLKLKCTLNSINELWDMLDFFVGKEMLGTRPTINDISGESIVVYTGIGLKGANGIFCDKVTLYIKVKLDSVVTYDNMRHLLIRDYANKVNKNIPPIVTTKRF